MSARNNQNGTAQETAGAAAPTLRVAFRCDASVRIGTGHVMRCLTLADALREQGAECVFLSRPHEGNLISFVEARGYRIVSLSPPDTSEMAILSDDPTPLPAHAGWLGRGWAEDAAETAAALGPEGTDWLIVDHYALDRCWEEALRPLARRIMAIDDLADRPHDCDLLLDQNLGRKAEDYAPHVPANTPLFIGPANALLRPDFAQVRAASLARREPPVLKRLLITMGGVDQDNVTEQILSVLAGQAKSDALASLEEIEVVLGAAAPWVEAVRKAASQMPWPTRVRVAIPDMADTMARADLAIGAAGGTSWERCCLGLPTIQMVLAANQIEAARALEITGAVIAVEISGLQQALPNSLIGLSGERLATMTNKAAMITDGRGALTLARTIGSLS